MSTDISKRIKIEIQIVSQVLQKNRTDKLSKFYGYIIVNKSIPKEYLNGTAYELISIFKIVESAARESGNIQWQLNVENISKEPYDDLRRALVNSKAVKGSGGSVSAIIQTIDSLREISDNVNNEEEIEVEIEDDGDVEIEIDEDSEDNMSESELIHKNKDELDAINISNEEKSNERYLEAFRRIYEGEDENSSTPLRTAIDGIMKSIYDLYMECYSGINHVDGILTHNGLLSLDKFGNEYRFVYNHTNVTKDTEIVGSESYIKYKQNSGMYGKYYKAIMYGIGVAMCGAEAINGRALDKKQIESIVNNAVSSAESKFGKAIDGRKNPVPKYKDAINHNQMNYYPKLHTEFMTGNFHVSKEMLEWAESNHVRRNGVKITNFDDLMKWARIRVSNCLTQALIDAGLKIEDAGYNDSEVTSVCQEMAKRIKNIIIIPNMRKGYFNVKICSSKDINESRLTKAVEDYFNSGSAGSKAASVIARSNGEESGVVSIDIILNKDEYNKSSTLSADVIDNIIESGSIPSWSNAVLGEKSTGGALYYDFKKHYAVSIYGSTGSGKGIMTSALLSNAMAEGCSILYIDGKPDNGAALAKIAWDNGVEAPVFNCNSGIVVGGTCKTFQNYLESYSHGIRSVDIRNNEIAKIPDIDNKNWPFSASNTVLRTQLYEVSMYLNSFQLVHDIIIKRSQGNGAVEILPNGKERWVVFVIDEIENAANNELIVRDAMIEYMNKVGDTDVYKTEKKVVRGETIEIQKRDGKIKDQRNNSKDAGYMFCKNWLEWADGVCANWQSVATISLRNSSSTLITIFQSNRWFNQSGNVRTGSTKIGKLMLGISAKVIKIVGKGGLVSDNTWGDQKEYAWSDDINNSKWVISSAEGKLSDTDTVFKPFQIFTTDLGAGINVPVDDYGAGADKCWKTSEDKSNPNMSKPKGLQSYMNYLFNGLSNEINEQVKNGDRLGETTTPHGVLKSSFDYFNRMTGGNIIKAVYNVDVLDSVDVSNVETVENAKESLDSLNSGLSSTPIDFGSDNSDISSTSIKSVEDTDKIIGSLKLMTTKKLISSNFSDTILMEYFKRVIEPSCFARNAYNYNNRDPRKSGGLRMAAIHLSSLCYIEERNILDLGELRLTAVKMIKNLNDGNNNWKYLLGMLDDFSSGQLELDEMPSPDRMKEYIDMYSDAVEIEVEQGKMYGYDSGIDEKEEELGGVYSPEEEIYRGEESFKVREDGTIKLNVRSTQNVVVLNKDDYIMASIPKYATAERFKKKLFESINGVSYEFKKRWDYVLDSISSIYYDKSLIRRIGFTERHIVVNGKLINFGNILGGDECITVADILDISATLKRFKFIQSISFDSVTSQCLIDEYGSSVEELWKIFEQNKNLNRIEVTSNSNTKVFKREDFLRKPGEVSKFLNIQLTRMQMEQFSAYKNPRLDEKKAGYLNRVMNKNNKSKASGKFRNMIPKINVQPEKVKKFAKNTLIGTTAIVVVGSVVGLPGLLLGLGSGVAFGSRIRR